MSDPTIGERLKAERERRGISTQKAADDMHLDAWVIEALEAGDYARIGPSVYAKGYLRKYASTLGVTTGEVAMGADKPAAGPRPPVMRVSSTPGPAAGPALGLLVPLIGLLIVSIVAAVLYYRPWRGHSSGTAASAHAAAGASNPAGDSIPLGASNSAGVPSPASSSGPASAATGGPRAASLAPSSESAPSAGAQSGAAQSGAAPSGAAPSTDSREAAETNEMAIANQNATSTGYVQTAQRTLASPSRESAPSPGAAPLRGAGPARLRLSFSADSWVDVQDASGRRVFAGQGRANSVKTVAGLAPLKVYLGYASGVQLEVNDHAVAIGRQFVSGDVARFEAGADGVLRRVAPGSDGAAGAIPRH